MELSTKEIPKLSVNFKKYLPVIIGAVILIIILIAVFFTVFWRYFQKSDILSEEEINDDYVGLGSDLYKNAVNPIADKLPTTNPFSAKTNPFKETEINPIKANYQNPF